MTADPALAEHLRRLEEELLGPDVRRSRAALEARLAPGFLEFGSSGRVYERAALVAALAEEPPSSIRIEDFAVRLLAPDVALATYRSVRTDAPDGTPGAARRSSVWRRDGETWRMVFHQGTFEERPSATTIRPAYTSWPLYNRRLREAVAAMTAEELAVRPSPERWPIWAVVGHLACQRVFWLCDFAGEPGADTTPFTNAAYDCPGDDDLEHVLSAGELVEALDASFRIVERCLDHWTPDVLGEELRRPEWNGSWVHTRGSVIGRVLSHDVYHCAELNEALGIAGLAQIDLWG